MAESQFERSTPEKWLSPTMGEIGKMAESGFERSIPEVWFERSTPENFSHMQAVGLRGALPGSVLGGHPPVSLK